MFITFEGIDGSGKTTALRLAAGWLRELGLTAKVTREPGASSLGQALRSILLDMQNTDLTPTAELCLYMADRAQHVAEIIRPALADGQIVLCDRFTDSTLAYQGYGRGLDINMIRLMNNQATGHLDPDLTLLFDLPAEQGLARARQRNQDLLLENSEGRFEAERLDFHGRVRAGFLSLAEQEPGRFAIINAGAEPDQVLSQVRLILADRINLG